MLGNPEPSTSVLCQSSFPARTGERFTIKPGQQHLGNGVGAGDEQHGGAAEEQGGQQGVHARRIADFRKTPAGHGHRAASAAVQRDAYNCPALPSERGGDGRVR